MYEKIKQFELCFRNIGDVVIPAELIDKLILRDIRMVFIANVVWNQFLGVKVIEVF